MTTNQVAKLSQLNLCYLDLSIPKKPFTSFSIWIFLHNTVQIKKINLSTSKFGWGFLKSLILRLYVVGFLKTACGRFVLILQNSRLLRITCSTGQNVSTPPFHLPLRISLSRYPLFSTNSNFYLVFNLVYEAKSSKMYNNSWSKNSVVCFFDMVFSFLKHVDTVSKFKVFIDYLIFWGPGT